MAGAGAEACPTSFRTNCSAAPDSATLCLATTAAQHPIDGTSVASGLSCLLARVVIGLGVAFGGEALVKAVATPVFAALLREPAGYTADRVYLPVKYLAQTWMAVSIVAAGPATMVRAGGW